MDKLACFSFFVDLENEDDLQKIRDDLNRIFENWLCGKGKIVEEGKIILHRGGRNAVFQARETECSLGSIKTFSLDEPVTGGRFKTDFGIALSKTRKRIAVFIELRGQTKGLAPKKFSVYPPHVSKGYPAK